MDLSPVRRSRDGAVLAGVCAGLARRWHVDPLVLRVAVVVLSLFAGLGVAVYLGAVLLVPKEGSADFPIRTILPFTRNWPVPAVIGSVVALGIFVMTLIGGWSPIGVGPAIGLGFLWYFGFYRHRARAARPYPPSAQPGPTTAPASPTEFQRAATAWQQRVAEQRLRAQVDPAVEVGEPTAPGAAVFPVHPAYQAVAPVQPARAVQPVPTLQPVDSRPLGVRRARTSAGWIWPATLCLIGLSLAGLRLAAQADLAVPDLAYWAAALGCVGAALVMSTWFGRPRWLLFSGVGLAVVTALLMGPVHRIDDLHVGTQTWTYTTTSQLPSSRSLDAGDLTLDLSHLAITHDADVTITLGAGHLLVRLPPSGNTAVDWTIGTGTYRSPDSGADGMSLQGTYSSTDGSSSGVLHLHLNLRLGELEVRR